MGYTKQRVGNGKRKAKRNDSLTSSEPTQEEGARASAFLLDPSDQAKSSEFQTIKSFATNAAFRKLLHDDHIN